MAWITVDQSLIGGRLRSFAKKSGISQNEAIGILVRLWLWGLDNAEEDGQLTDAEHEDIEDAIRTGFLGADGETISDIVDKLVECGWIEQKNERFYLCNVEDWGSSYTSYIEKKEKHAEQMRRYRAGKKKEQKKQKPDPEPEKQEPEKEPEQAPAKKAKRNEYAVAFEEFWKAYPRKLDKGNAYKKYQARLKDGFSDADLLTAATNYADQCKREKTEEKYIKHPKTFLSDAMPFTDYLDAKKDEPQEQPTTVVSGTNPFRKKK